MSTRWMAVQYVGDTLRLPIANESDMDKPFGVSELERGIRRIVVNPFSDSPRTFVPEAENAKLRELVRDMWNEGMCECGSRGKCARCEYDYPDRMRELGVEV